jgi:AAA+ ATPase superfamily predicted ATPase
MELYQRQKEYMDLFETYLLNGESKLLSSKQRRWGKTTILNEIGLTYQLLGYRVFLITQYPNSNEHVATNYVSNAESIRGYKEKSIALIDEYYYFDENLRDILHVFDKLDIPYVGFVDYGR